MSENDAENVQPTSNDADAVSEVESSSEPADPSIIERGMAALGIGADTGEGVDPESPPDPDEPKPEIAIESRTYKSCAAENAAAKRQRKYGR
jgi:hypothetical protein